MTTKHPCTYAARYTENPAVVEALLAAGADVAAQDNIDRTPLSDAAEFNDNPVKIASNSSRAPPRYTNTVSR